MKEIKSKKEFNDLVTGDKPFVIDFYADWCGPCQTLLPVVNKLANEYKEEVSIVKVNIDKQKDIATKFNIRSIPTLFFGEGAKIKDRLNGLASEHTLRKKIEALAS